MLEEIEKNLLSYFFWKILKKFFLLDKYYHKNQIIILLLHINILNMDCLKWLFVEKYDISNI